jgi:hypothetical protein
VPMAYWVHLEQDGLSFSDARTYEPPAPAHVSRKGYPVLCIEFGKTVLRFSSGAQIDEFIEIMSRKPLPPSSRLARLRGAGTGPNTHWLSRLPSELKVPKMRRVVVGAVQSVLGELRPNRSVKADPLLQAVACIGSAYLQRYTSP